MTRRWMAVAAALAVVVSAGLLQLGGESISARATASSAPLLSPSPTPSPSGSASIGSSSVVSPVCVNPSPGSAGIPEAFTITSVTPGETTLSIAFTIPGSSATPQYIRIVLNGVDQIASGVSSPIQATGLSPGTDYSVAICGGAPGGDGDASNVVNTRTLGDPPRPPTPVVSPPGAAGITVTRVTSTSIDYTVGVPSSTGGEIPTVYSTGLEGQEQEINPEQRTRSITGLRPNTGYVITASARNSAGSGPVTRQTVRTERGVPAAPVVTVRTGNRKAQVSWTVPDSNGATIRAYRVTDASGRIICSVTGTSCEVPIEKSGVNVTYRVTSVTEDGVGLTGSGSAFVPVTTPGPVRNAKAEYEKYCKSCDAYNIVVSWTMPLDDGGSPITSVTWDSGRETTVAKTRVPLKCTTRSPTATSCTWTLFGLSTPAMGIEITARNALGDGVPVIVTAGRPASAEKPTPPAAPVGLQATAASGGSTVLSWAYPSEVADVRPDTYRVEVSQCGRACATEARLVQTVTCDPWGLPGSCRISGLDPRAKHLVRVISVNANGESPSSVALAAEAPAVPPTPPGAPQGVTATDQVYAITVSWQPPTSEGSAPISGYRVLHGWGAVACTVPATARSCKVEYSNPGPRRISVEAFSEDGTGPAVSVTGHPRLPGTPGAPRRVGAIPGDGRVLVYWEPDFTTNQERFEVYDASGRSRLCSVSGVENSCRVTATNGAATTFLVQAVGSGTASTQVRTPTVTPSRIPVVTRVTANAREYSSTVQVTFPAITGWGFEPITYRVNAGGSSCIPAPSFSSLSELTCFISGLPYGTQSATVTATGSGSSSTSAPVSFTLTAPPPKPDPPLDPRASVTTNSIVVTWRPPANAAVSKVTSYKVMSANGQTCEVSAPQLSCTFAVTTPGEAWNFYLSSLNALQESTSSTTGYVIAGPPRDPTGVRAQAAGSGDVIVSWDSDGQSDVESAVVRAIPGPGYCQAAGRATSCRMTGVGLGVRQTFSVTLRNGAGFSNPVQGGDVLLVVPSPARDPLLRVEGRTAVITWEASLERGSPDALSYEVTNAVTGARACMTDTTSCTVSGIPDGTRVRYFITAVNPVGRAQAVSTELVQVGAPTAPREVTLTQVGQDVVVRWQAPESWGARSSGRYLVGSTSGTCDTTATTCTIAKPPAGRDLDVVVRAITDVAESPTSRATLRVVRKPSKPTSVAVSPGDRSLVVEWAPPVDADANPVTRYTVSLLEWPFRVREVCNVPADARECEVRGLENEQNYGIVVVASNVAGEGAPSDAVFGQPTDVQETAVRPPGPVRDARVVYDKERGEVTVTWKPPLDTGGVRRPNYTVLMIDQGIRGYGCLTRALSCTVKVEPRFYTATYRVFVQAHNSAGFPPDPVEPVGFFTVEKK